MGNLDRFRIGFQIKWSQKRELSLKCHTLFAERDYIKMTSLISEDYEKEILRENEKFRNIFKMNLN